jgi:hypothetical protein
MKKGEILKLPPRPPSVFRPGQDAPRAWSVCRSFRSGGLAFLVLFGCPLLSPANPQKQYSRDLASGSLASTTSKEPEPFDQQWFVTEGMFPRHRNENESEIHLVSLPKPGAPPERLALETELAHLRKFGTPSEWFALVPTLKNADSRARVVREIQTLKKSGTVFATDGMSETACVGYLEVFRSSINRAELYAWYVKQCQRHPGLPARLGTPLLHFEVLRLRDAGHFSEALLIALDLELRVDDVSLRDLAVWLRQHPAALPEGLPPVADPKARPLMVVFVQTLVPMMAPENDSAERHQTVEFFNRLARHDEWLEAARKAKPTLYHLTLARRGKIEQAVLLHEQEKDRQSLALLGALIPSHPEIGQQVPAERCSKDSLRAILEGGIGTCHATKGGAMTLSALAEAWEAHHPGLLDVKALFNRSEIPREALSQLVNRLMKDKPVTAAKIRLGLVLAAVFRQRFKQEPVKVEELANWFHNARKMALNFWLGGEEETAWQVMFEAFQRDSDPDERADARFAELAVCMGRGEQALAALDQRQAEISSPLHGMKRARLLRALGRSEEAVKCTFEQKQPALLLGLQIETGDWEGAIHSTHDFEPRDDKRREAMKGYIAYLSGNPELIGCLTAPDSKTIAMLHCDEFEWVRFTLRSLSVAPPAYDWSLRRMAQDALLAATYEARLANSIAAREPVPIEVMECYFRPFDLLPDRRKSARLARALAALDRSQLIIPGSRTVPNEVYVKFGHKLVAAQALLHFGRGDWAFDAVRPIMAECKEWADFSKPGDWSVHATAVGYRGVLKLAQLEWPAAAVAGRIDHLAAILDQPEAIDRARGMIALAAKHRQSMEKMEVLQVFWLTLFDLAQAAVVPDDMKATVRDLIESYQPTDKDRNWLEVQWTRRDWNYGSSMPAYTKNEKIADPPKPTPGSNSDPMSPDFVMLDGIAEAKALWDKGEKQAASTLLHRVIIRLLLDDLPIREVPGGSRSVGRRSPGEYSTPHNNPLACFDVMELAPELIRPYIDICWRADWCAETFYSLEARLWWASRLHAKAGDTSTALKRYRLHLFARDSWELGQVAGLVKLEALVAAEQGNRATYLSAFRRHLQLLPYEPESGADMVAALRVKGDAEAIAETAKLIDAFWTAKLLAIPESGTYKFWWKQWQAAIGNP